MILNVAVFCKNQNNLIMSTLKRIYLIFKMIHLIFKVIYLTFKVIHLIPEAVCLFVILHTDENKSMIELKML